MARSVLLADVRESVRVALGLTDSSIPDADVDPLIKNGLDWLNKDARPPSAHYFSGNSGDDTSSIQPALVDESYFTLAVEESVLWYLLGKLVEAAEGSIVRSGPAGGRTDTTSQFQQLLALFRLHLGVAKEAVGQIRGRNSQIKPRMFGLHNRNWTRRGYSQSYNLAHPGEHSLCVDRAMSSLNYVLDDDGEWRKKGTAPDKA